MAALIESQNDILIIACILTILCAAFAYSKYLETQQDLSPVALSNQTSISSTRKQGETAVLRNKLVPHGFPLLHGLQIKDSYKLRDGNVRDIWSLAIDHPSKYVTFYDYKGLQTQKFSYSQMNHAMKIIAAMLSSESCHKIGCVLGVYDWRSILVSLACFTNNLTFHTTHTRTVRQTLSSFDAVVIPYSCLQEVVRYGSAGLIILVDPHCKEAQSDKYSLDDYRKAISPRKLVLWDDVFGDFVEDSVYEHHHSLENEKVSPLLETQSYNTTEYTHQNIVAAVAHELKQLPDNHSLTSKDHALIMCYDSSLVFLPKIFAALISGLDVSIVAPLKLLSIKSADLEEQTRFQEREDSIIYSRFVKCLTKLASRFSSNNTVVATIPEKYLKVYAEKKQETFGQTSMVSRLLFGRSQMLLSQNVFTTMAKDPLFANYRLIYNYSFKNIKSEMISSFDLSMVRSLTGCRIISERYVPGTLSPLFVTHMYDYRITEEDNHVLRGVPSQTIEAKLIDYELLSDKCLADNDEGELCVRGFIIGKSTDEEIVKQKIEEIERAGGEGWMPTGLIGKIGEDGCFYEKFYDI